MKETTPGQDVFIIGGKANGEPIDIRMNSLPEKWEKYNGWAKGDNQLDWNGYAQGQVKIAL